MSQRFMREFDTDYQPDWALGQYIVAGSEGFKWTGALYSFFSKPNL